MALGLKFEVSVCEKLRCPTFQDCGLIGEYGSQCSHAKSEVQINARLQAALFDPYLVAEYDPYGGGHLSAHQNSGVNGNVGFRFVICRTFFVGGLAELKTV